MQALKGVIEDNSYRRSGPRGERLAILVGACLHRRGHKKDHNAASVEGRYRGQYLPTPRSARRTPRNPSPNRASAGTALHTTLGT